MLSLVLRNGESFPTLLDTVMNSQDLKVYSHFRHEVSLAHRPLEPIANYPSEPQAISIESLRQWENSAEFEAARAMFSTYPERSLCRPIDRMLLYHLVRSMRPENVLEIGTYFGAGSEVMTRGLWENGKGTLHTIDPFGPIRGPALIGRWNEALQRHVRFYPWSSMELFQRLAEQQTPIDMAFIDGNHDFEFALFDLQSAARFMSPGGVVVMDDANQSGPFWASKVFLEQNPGWSELGDCLSKAETDPFGPLPTTFLESKFVLLQAPREVVVGRLPYTTGQVAANSGQLEGIAISVAPGQHGEILGRVFLRAFPSGTIPQQLVSSFRTALNGECHLEVPLAERLRTNCADEALLPRHSIEIVLLWRPRRQGDALRLSKPPKPISELEIASEPAATLPMTAAALKPRDVASRAA
jgi:predicted O-methyltransferase YrrM